MRKALTFVTALICLLMSLYSMAQCAEAGAAANLHGNSVSTYIPAGGKLFTYPDSSKFEYNIISNSDTTKFASIGTLWIGGYDSGGDLKMAAQTYRQNGTDFWAGPLIGSTQIPTASTCGNYDRVWQVKGTTVEAHIQQYLNNGAITTVDSSLLLWPGRNNPHIAVALGFALPANRDFAPFYDHNNDNIYNPYDGDYPTYRPYDGGAIAADLTWTVFNDYGNIHSTTNGQPLQIEVQQTAYALACNADTILDETIFVHYKLTSYNSDTLFDTRLGMWFDTDRDLGDEYYGTASNENAMFVYGTGSYPTDPKSVISFKFLNQLLDQSMYYENSNDARHGNPASATQYYRLLDGQWLDGSPLAYGGYGYNGMTATPYAYAFDGRPTDFMVNSWTMYNEQMGTNDFRILLVHNIDTLVPGTVETLEMAMTHHLDTNVNTHLAMTDMVYDELPQLQQWYDNGFPSYCFSGLRLNTQQAQQEAAAVRLFPNPSKGQFSLQLAREGDYQLRVLDGLGRLVHQQSLPAGTLHQIQLPPLAAGLYHWQLTEQGEIKQTDKLILQR